jgi:serine/threonine-protein kinase
MIGSPFYMSPEQILGSKGVDQRSDLWSVGVVTYEALTGKKPFDAETMGGLAIKIHSEPLPLPSSIVPELGPAVDAWFQRACARRAEDRFGSAKEMAEALAAAVGGQMPKSVEVPRISTGTADVPSRSTTLVAGATTEAGLVRGTSPPSSGSKLVRAALMLGSVAGRGRRAGFGRPAVLKPAAGPPPTPSQTSTTVLLPVSAEPPAVASVTPPQPSRVTRPGGGGHVQNQTRPTNSGNPSSVTTLPSQAAPPTTARPPATNDIF